ncbi:MAG: 2-amino-4-hydroxy-6-hydroxymethyldihydropteridine diphosphokinase [Actinobacteria bacterium]|nr:MAG: 2-amino-4-hydroxy-6-hydroxymethyldihydropteridine diphosphokinase [Actinomycetota bacterium]
MTARPVRVYLGLGSNLGDRLGHLTEAVARLARTPGLAVTRTSRVYETAPVGPPQPDYLNAVVEVITALDPKSVLELARRIEDEMGRERGERWGPRVIDIDVLLHGSARIDEPGLTVPHPRMHERAFVLVPLLELEADPVLPGGRSLGDVRLEAIGRSDVRLFAPALPIPPGATGSNARPRAGNDRRVGRARDTEGDRS